MTNANDPTKRTRTFNLEFWIPAVLGGAALIWFLVLPSWRNVSGHWRASSWIETDGQVTVSERYRTENQERQQMNYRFRYRYEVDGKQYDSSRYSFRYASGDQRTAVKTHDAGDTVPVLFDPSAPSQSVIERDSSPWWNYVVLGSLIFIPAALVIRWKRLQ